MKISYSKLQKKEYIIYYNLKKLKTLHIGQYNTLLNINHIVQLLSLSEITSLFIVISTKNYDLQTFEKEYQNIKEKYQLNYFFTNNYGLVITKNVNEKDLNQGLLLEKYE